MPHDSVLDGAAERSTELVDFYKNIQIETDRNNFHRIIHSRIDSFSYYNIENSQYFLCL